ncbi:hypothetical protein BU16DRAFT_343751 [Lophium mytilinum]|uniref:Uncharacterized protein n=1 Tax=Lophium mytilinum TaxID=390894 RepID=A0A6A6QXF1_9PEZI|nr:hypothetical protein BU16DRAFT_343751 [Lophium mytilinum]
MAMKRWFWEMQKGEGHASPARMRAHKGGQRLRSEKRHNEPRGVSANMPNQYRHRDLALRVSSWSSFARGCVGLRGSLLKHNTCRKPAASSLRPQGVFQDTYHVCSEMFTEARYREAQDAAFAHLVCLCEGIRSGVGNQLIGFGKCYMLP